jgi:predicted RNase H-like HicB family nuclease
MKPELEINVYGFKAKITRSEGWYVGVIEDLHVVDQGKTLKALEERLKEGAELALEEIFKSPAKEAKNYPKSVLAKLGMRAHA